MQEGLPRAPVYMYPDDEVGRLRRQTIAIAAVLVLLVVAFALVRDTGAAATPPEQAAKLVAQGQNAYLDGDYPAARAHFTEAERRDPKNAQAHFFLGLLMQVVDNNPAGAEAQYRTAIETDPKHARALFNLGVLRARAGAKAEAIDLYRRAIAANDRLAGAHLNLGLLLREADTSSTEAVLELQRAVVLDSSLARRIPDDPPPTTTSTTTKKR